MRKLKSYLAGTAMSFIVVSGMVAPSAGADQHAAIKAAVEHPDRPAAEKARDANRKPAEVLAFAGIEPGMTVLDINSAGGYYTELLAHVVGKEGKVYAHNGKVYFNFMNRTVPPRFANRLPNVEPLNNDTEFFNVPENSVDVAISALAYHDYFFMPEVRPEEETIPAVLGSLYSVIKPGGTVIIVDHEAKEGTGTDLGNSLHRLHSSIVKEQMTNAGFTLVEESDALSNSTDDHDISVVAPEVRGKTDRYILKFKKDA